MFRGPGLVVLSPASLARKTKREILFMIICIHFFYRTLDYLMRHLYKVSLKGHQTGMTAKNLAIVWAPNLLRSKDLNHKNHNNNNNLKDIALQAVCTEFLIKHCDLLFASHLPTVSMDQSFELGIIEGNI